MGSKKASQSLEKTPLELRVYSSQLLGLDSDLVLHGGGNTGKVIETNIFGEEEVVLYVKGSGRNLATIDSRWLHSASSETKIKKLVELVNISDTILVREQQLAMTNPDSHDPL